MSSFDHQEIELVPTDDGIVPLDPGIVPLDDGLVPCRDEQAVPAEPCTGEQHSPLSAEISTFASCHEISPNGSITVLQFIQDVRSGKYREPIEEIRECLTRGDDDRADSIKKTLPAVSLSGLVTEGQRGKAFADGRFRHIGYLQGDFDLKDFRPRSADEIKAVLADDEHVAAVFLSAGGGVKTIIRIPVCESPAEHKSAFSAAESYFLKKYELKLDASTKDPVRLCYVSYDPDAFVKSSTVRTLPFAPDDKANGESKTPRPEAGRKDNENANTKYDKITPETIRAMLNCIPSRPDYDMWLKISSAVWAAAKDESTGTALLKNWSPEESKGEYSEKFKSRLSDIGAGTLVHLALENGYEFPTRSEEPTNINIPKDVFPLPNGEIEYRKSGGKIFSAIAPYHQLFIRGRIVHEVVAGDDEPAYLAPVSAKRFCSVVEHFGHRVARREWQEAKCGEEKGKFIWRSARMPIKTAEILLQADAAVGNLFPVRQLAACPILTKEGAVIGRGYHAHAGGTFVTDGTMPPEVPLEAATTAILSLLDDIDFVTSADKSRAVANILSPALKMGDWLNDDFPMDVAEADRSQSGKTYRQKLVNRIYNEIPSAHTAPRGGVGSLDETISSALIKGRPFIMLDNFRGKLDSTILEQAIRGAERVSCRALRTSADVDTRPFIWQLSTNGAEFTRDIANRSLITRIRKQSEEYQFKEYPEGGLLSHVVAKQPFYLGAVFSVIKEWARNGCPKTAEKRHDFRDWCQTMDWIVQNIFKLAPLLDGHREEQARTANPALQWLRDVAMAARNSGFLNRELTTAQLVSIAEDAGIDFPGNSLSREEPHQRAGKIIGKVFRDTEDQVIAVDGHTVTREERSVHVEGRGYEKQKRYTIREITKQ